MINEDKIECLRPMTMQVLQQTHKQAFGPLVGYGHLKVTIGGCSVRSSIVWLHGMYLTAGVTLAGPVYNDADYVFRSVL